MRAFTFRTVALSVGVLSSITLGSVAYAGTPEKIGTVQQGLSSYKDSRPWSRDIPGLDASDLPQFVGITFDDNFYVDGVEWANGLENTLQNPAGTGNARTFDGMPVRTTFFSNCIYIDPSQWPGVASDWAAGYAAGNEIANHTWSHKDGTAFAVADWTPEIANCTAAFADPANAIGPMTDDILGFRTPFLRYDDATFTTLVNQGLTYDASLQSCWGDDEDGTNCSFPHTLDNGSPDNAVIVKKFGEPTITPHPGLWEIPLSSVVVPPDSLAAQYGFDVGLRTRVAAAMVNSQRPDYYELKSGRVGPLDYTLWVTAQMAPAELQATLEYTFDLHRKGNRAPFVFVAHTHVYSSKWNAAPNAPDPIARRGAIEGFLKYALSHSETRMRPVRDLLAWMRAPISLSGKEPVLVTGTGGTSSSGGASASGSTSGGGLGGAGATTQADAAKPDVADSGCGCRTARSLPETNARLISAVALALAAFGMRRARRAAT
jgi:hypothetical protein